MKVFRFLAVALALVVCFSVPALAADGWHNITFASSMVDTSAVYYDSSTEEAYWIDITSQTATTTTWSIPAISSDTSTITFVVDFPVAFSVSAGDVVAIDTFLLKWFIGGSENYVSRFRVCMGVSPLSPEHTSQWISTGYTSGHATQSYQVPNLSIDITKDSTVSAFFIQFDIYHPLKGNFSLYNFSTNVSYGNPDSPQAPGYIKPDGGVIDDYHDLEQGILNDTESGMNAANGIFSGFADNIFGFVSGLLFVSELMGLFIVKVPVVGLLIQISLALGLFGVLVGLSGSIIGAKERHDRNVEYRNRVYWERVAANNRRKMREARESRRRK